MTHDTHESAPQPAVRMGRGEVLLHWTILIAVMTALIGGAALIF